MTDGGVHPFFSGTPVFFGWRSFYRETRRHETRLSFITHTGEFWCRPAYVLDPDEIGSQVHQRSAVVYVPRTMDAQTVTRSPHPEGSQSGGCGIGGGMWDA